MVLLHVLHGSVPSPTVFTWGMFSLHWYGLLFALGVAAGYAVVRREWHAHQLPVLELAELVSWLVLAGIVGARLLDVFTYEWWYFRSHLGEVLAIWQGGLAFHGGLAASFGTLVAWAKRRGLSWLTLADTFAPGLALAQAIGRWGNYFNQELFGSPTVLPWGIPIVRAFRPLAFLEATYFHPVFLYESLGLAILALLLWQLRRYKLVAGSRFAVYLVLAGVLRFVLEFVRVDEQAMLAGLRVGTIVAAVIVVAGLVLWGKVHASAKRLV